MVDGYNFDDDEDSSWHIHDSMPCRLPSTLTHLTPCMKYEYR